MKSYLAIARVDHWFKNVFALPGVLVALLADPSPHPHLLLHLGLGLGALCLTASANYAINEYLDGPFDRLHPVKKNRPAARGELDPRLVTAMWLVLGSAGLALGSVVNVATGASVAALLVMGLVYNVPPVRTKDLPYVDVLSESVNNPIRLWTGWALTGTHLMPPLSLVLAYWLIGAFFMAVKRLAEWRHIGADKARTYRPSFRHYDDEKLLVAIVAYASGASLFGGMFIRRYRLELVMAIPMMAVLLGWYLHVGFKEESPAMSPERLYRDPGLTLWIGLTFAVCCAMLWFRLPFLATLFSPSMPAQVP